MANEPDKKFGYPTNCWNCASPLPVFTYSCGICGADNTPLDQLPVGKGAPKSDETRDVLKEKLARQREAIRRSLKGD